MLGKLLFHVISGILGLFLAVKFVPGVTFSGTIRMLFVIGAFLGLVNFSVRPILNKISLPLRILTFGLFSLVINMLLIWLVADVFFPQDIEIKGLLALLWTTLIIWVLNLFFGLTKDKK
jgi:putative membrane protein